MSDKKYLLNTEQMANFVADGYLRFDELIPSELNEAATRGNGRGDYCAWTRQGRF